MNVLQTVRPPTLRMIVLVGMVVLSLGRLGSAAEPAPGFRVASSRFLGSVWNQGHADASVISQDGGYSYAVPGGSLWWFGDTFKGSRDASGEPHFAGGAVSCSVALLGATHKKLPPVLEFLVDHEQKVAQAIQFLPGESWEHHRIWPLAGIHLGGKSYVYYDLIEITGKGAWDFKSVGSGLARSDKPLSVHQRVETDRGWRFPVQPSALVAADDWLYLFDVEKRGKRQGMWLSRVRPGDIERPDAYEFYHGPGPAFSRDQAQQSPLLEGIYGQASIVWNAYLKQYLLASSSDLFHPREIRFHTASKPFGPWSKPVARVMVPDRRQGKKVSLVYCTFFHPELFRENGRVLNLTFSLQLEKAGFDANNEMVELEIKPRAE